MSLSINPKTFYAPAERACFSQIAEEYLSFSDSDLPVALEGEDERAFLVFNRFRQLIYANSKLLDLVGLKSIERLLGLRLGEIFGCTHATDNLGGCGTQVPCSNCCAINAMLAALDGRPVSDVCCILVERNRRDCALKFNIAATPFDFKGQPCIAVHLTKPVWTPVA
jgi:hypothetical protein